MITRKVTYKNFDGVEKTKILHFNLSKAELFDMEMNTPGGVEPTMKRAIETEDRQSLINFVRMMVHASYGEKSDDGEYFLKTDANGNKLIDKFVHTEAYSEFFIGLLSNPDATNAFLVGVMPQDLVAEVVKENPQFAEVAKEAREAAPAE